MPFLPYLICQTLLLWLSVAPFFMLLRSLRSVLVQGKDATSIDYLLALTTEPLIMPMRFLFGPLTDGLPFDIPFLLSFLFIPFLRGALPAITLA